METKDGLRAHVERALEATRKPVAWSWVAGCWPRRRRFSPAQFGDKPALVVADETTFAVAGRAVVEAFRRARRAVEEPYIYTDPQLYAENRFVAALEEVLRARPEAIPVAVGSGTINDLTKLAAHRAGRRYVAVGTAASMDGYTAYGASITYNGSKQTFPCPAPIAVVADLDVMRAAPAELNAAGYADLMAKTVAGADWLLADAVGNEAINPGAWDIIQGRLREVLANPAGVRAGDLDTLNRLAQGLMLGGFAMVWARSSRVASGAEHLFSHIWDMQHHTHKGKIPWHGFKVGIGTLAVSALYECLLSLPLAELDLERCCARWPGPGRPRKADPRTVRGRRCPERCPCRKPGQGRGPGGAAPATGEVAEGLAALEPTAARAVDSVRRSQGNAPGRRRARRTRRHRHLAPTPPPHLSGRPCSCAAGSRSWTWPRAPPASMAPSTSCLGRRDDGGKYE